MSHPPHRGGQATSGGDRDPSSPLSFPSFKSPCNSSLLNLQNLVISYFESPESPKSQTDTLKGLPNSSIPPQYKKSPKQLNAAKKSLLLTQLLMNI